MELCLFLQLSGFAVLAALSIPNFLYGEPLKLVSCLVLSQWVYPYYVHTDKHQEFDLRQ